MALSWQDYIDSMEGLVELRNKLDAIDSQEQKKAPTTTDELSLVWYT